jgi:hypothetical protein
LILVQKRLAAATLEERRVREAMEVQGRGDVIVNDLWHERTNDDGTEPPGVLFAEDLQGAAPEEATYLFERSRVVGDISGPNWRRRQEILEGMLSNITQVLAAYDLLDGLSLDEQADLVTAIRKILQAFDL